MKPVGGLFAAVFMLAPGLASCAETTAYSELLNSIAIGQGRTDRIRYLRTKPNVVYAVLDNFNPSQNADTSANSATARQVMWEEKSTGQMTAARPGAR